jgi:hypothetical protein
MKTNRPFERSPSSECSEVNGVRYNRLSVLIFLQVIQTQITVAYCVYHDTGPLRLRYGLYICRVYTCHLVVVDIDSF